MKLNNIELKNAKQWEEAGFNIPKYDRDVIASNTKENPTWIHFGTGNLFRAFPANMQNTLLNSGMTEQGIIAVSGTNFEMIDKLFLPHDNLSVLVTLKSDGTIEKTVVGSIVEAITMDSENEKDWNRLKKIFSEASLQMASLTITEKGYSLANSQREYLPQVLEDFKNGPHAPKNYIGKIAALLYARYHTGKIPITLVSMDNCSHNGTILKEAISEFAKEWVKNGLVDSDFEEYINNPDYVSFPWSMIDKITPKTDEKVRTLLTASGFEDTEDVVLGRSKATPFVNSEETGYLVIEDKFPNGRPNLDKAGVIFTDRETVDKVEKMKVCTCLNPLHTTLAIFGCLLDFTTVFETVEDIQIKRLIEKVGYTEGLPVVVNPGIVDPKQFIDNVLQVRLPNPFINDTPQRIATDTSKKLGIRFGETIKAYAKQSDIGKADLEFIPLVLAGWCRYLMGINDNGDPMVLSPDPLLEELVPFVKDIALGDSGSFHSQLQPILSNSNIFGINLYEVGIAEKVEIYFAELVAGKGSVRKTLVKYLGT